MAPEHQAERLQRLRAEIATRGLAAYLVPCADEFQNEYVAPSEERLGWITGFNGTAGFAVIGRSRAAIFVDGRYWLQAGQQCDPAFWDIRHVTTTPLPGWVKEHLGRGDRIGLDPRLHTPDGVERLRASLASSGVEVVPVEPNLVDAIWVDRPAPPRGPVMLYPEMFAGETSASKRERMAGALGEEGLDALVISAPDNLAWLFNIRGSDLEMTPSVLGYGILKADATAMLFLHPAKLSHEVKAGIEASGEVELLEPTAFRDRIAGLGGLTVRVDRATGSLFIAETVKAANARLAVGRDPCTAAKACKNPVELEGMRRAHQRDAVAIVRFLSWFSQRNALEHQTELTLADKLEDLRKDGERYRGPSFQTISAVAGNAAHAHYRLEPETARALRGGEIYLVDSGAQYLDGTTDVTRVLIAGTPTAEMKERYTQVLKGHIAISIARFPVGTTGAQLDTLARQFLWEAGVDFDHGTGHGVGCFLSVHEGPQSISKRGTETSLQPGMVVSVEPGYYKPDHFGIRIENLVAVRELDPQPERAELRTLGFETLTLAPYEQQLTEVGMLTAPERAWIDAYHARVRDTLTPALDKTDATFLAGATAPLAG